MIDYQKREYFAEYLNELINGQYSKDAWFKYIINHYTDKRLEEVRVNIVRLRIAAGDPEIFPVTEKHKEKLRDWINELQKTITKSQT